MKKALKILGIGLALIVLLALMAFAYVSFSDIPYYEIKKVDYHVKSSPEAIARGQKLCSMLCASCHLDPESGKLIAGPEFVTKGLSMESLAGPIRQAEQELKRWLERRPEGEPEVGYLVSQAKGITARSLFRKTKQRPLILPMVLEL